MTLRAPSSFAKGRTPTSKCSHGGYPAPSVVERMLGLGLAVSEIECAQGLKVAARLSCKAVNGTVLWGGYNFVCESTIAHIFEMLHFTFGCTRVCVCVVSLKNAGVYFETRKVSSESAQ